MKQHYHTILRPTSDGRFIGWVEEVPGTITRGESIAECRRNLRESLRIMLESIRSEARRGLDESCLQETLEIEEQELQLA